MRGTSGERGFGDPTFPADPDGGVRRRRDPKGRDRALLIATRTARGFGSGALSIVLALDLAASGYSALVIGALLGLALGFASVWTLAVPRFERAWGRHRVFAIGGIAFAAGGLLLWLGLSSPLAVLASLALGGIVAGSSDVSPLGALEQAALADVTAPASRTRTFASYNLAGYLGSAFGALLAGPLSGFSFGGALASTNGLHDTAVLLYGLLGFALVPAYLRLSTEIDRHVVRAGPTGLSRESRSPVYTLAGLFTVDAFGGGLILNSLVVYYLATRFAPSVDVLGVVFFLANVAAALSLVLSVPIAQRIGLVRTMVFTHLPSSVLLIAFAFSPTFLVAAVLWVLRSTLSQMDVPTRQAFTQAIVPPAERAAAASVTTAARSGNALGGPVTGAFLGAGGPWVAGPFILAGSVKIAYDLALYTRFRKLPLRPEPEEATTGDGARAPTAPGPSAGAPPDEPAEAPRVP